MATRLYFHNTTDSTTGLPSGEQSTRTAVATMDNTNKVMNTTIGTSQTSHSIGVTIRTSNTGAIVCGRWVSPALNQSSISANTWTYSFAARETDVGANYPVNGSNQAINVNCYVWRPSSSTKIGTIRDGTTAATVDEGAANTERASTATITGTAVSSMVSGDVIIFEAWAIQTDGAVNGTNNYYFDGTTVTTTDGTVSSHASFIETPENLTFAGAGTNYTRSPTAEDVTVSDASTTRILSALRLPSTDSITVADSSLTRQTQAFRTVSTDTTTVTDSSLVRSATRVRATAADSTTVADSSLTRTLSAVRVPTTEVPALSENLTRMTQAFRSPSTDTVTAVDSSTTKSATRVRAPTTDTVTPSDSSLTRILSAARVPSSDSTTVLDSSLTRVLSLLRIPFADSITTSENVTGQYTQGTAVIERAPSAENITVADASLTRLLSSLRLPSSDAVTTGESLIRVLSAIRSPSTDTVVTADNATGLRSLLRTPASDSINVLDSSLTRRLSATRLPSQDTITITAGTATRMLSAIRLPSVEVISVGESLGAQVSGRISRSVSDTVIVDENLVRILQAFRVPPADTINLNEQLTRSRTAVRLTTADTTVVSEAALTRVLALTRSVSSDTTAIIESALSRVLQAFRSLGDTVTVSEVVGIVGFTRALEDTVTITEPVLNRIVTAIRAVAPETVNVSESVFFQTFHKFVFDSVTVAESLFKIRTSLSGSVTYAIPDEVRPLLGNIGPTQRTDDQINLAIDAAYDEINTKTNRIPPNDWKDTDHNFGVIKKLARYIAAKEMAVGIKDFDTAALQTEIDRLWEILTYDTTSSATQNIVISSEPETYATSAAGIIWSTRYKGLHKVSSGENDTTINPAT